jgi:murein L,D-transpeptidase YcbB/YkuD
VPIYVTYLTVRVEGGALAYGPDPYKRDGGARSLAQRSGAAHSVVR